MENRTLNFLKNTKKYKFSISIRHRHQSWGVIGLHIQKYSINQPL